jgi:hypothetical protein
MKRNKNNLNALMRNEEKVLLNGMHDRVIDNCSRWDIFTTTTLPTNDEIVILYSNHLSYPYLISLIFRK